MPFIFHSKKQSIFDRKIQEQKDSEINLKCPDKQPQVNTQTFAPISMNICKQHPFRRFQQPQDLSNQNISVEQEAKHEKNETIANQKQFKPKIYKSRHILKSQQKENTPLSSKLQISVKNQESVQDLQTYFKARLSPKLFNHETSSFKKPIYLSQQRLNYSANLQTPGPGSYNPPLKNSSTSQLIYPTVTKTYPLPQKSKNQLIDSINSLEKKVDKKISQRKFNIYFSYKNQSSPYFKKSTLSSENKNSALMRMLFSNKDENNSKDNQSQTTCQSRLNHKTEDFDEDLYIKVEQKSPSPCSYDPSLQLSIKQKTNGNKQSKVFISGSPKFSDFKRRQESPGPGYYESNQKQIKNRQVFDQNQNKRPNNFPQYQQKTSKYVFSSSIPRQLDFGIGQKGSQELYYSPKTNLIDNLKEKQSKSTLSNQFYFGSSLERFGKDNIVETDPYKYSFAKTKIIEENSRKNGITISSKGKRQLFTDIKSNPSPFTYNNKVHTLQKSTHNTQQKLELKSLYNQQVVQLREKKQTMQKMLIDEKNKAMDLKSTQKPKKQLYPDSYKQYLLSKKRAQKKDISFGYNKKSQLNRAFKPKQQVDGYYETQPGWDVRSFNKQYGYNVYE